jgi:hypothetical protein
MAIGKLIATPYSNVQSLILRPFTREKNTLAASLQVCIKTRAMHTAVVCRAAGFPD